MSHHPGISDEIIQAYNDSLKRSWKSLEKFRALMTKYYNESRSELLRASKILSSAKERQRLNSDKTEVLTYNPYNDPRD